MELKKRELTAERSYAKKNEVSRKELKEFTPNKWIVASAMGVATLFYSNSKSIFGSIGVVFGCIPEQIINYSDKWYFINNISNTMLCLAIVLILILAGYIVFSKTILDKKFINKEIDEETHNKKIKNVISWVICGIIIIFVLIISHIYLDNVVLEQKNPDFYIGGEPKTSLTIVSWDVQ